MCRVCCATQLMSCSGPDFGVLRNIALATHLCSAHCAVYRQHDNNPPRLLCRLGLQWGMWCYPPGPMAAQTNSSGCSERLWRATTSQSTCMNGSTSSLGRLCSLMLLQQLPIHSFVLFCQLLANHFSVRVATRWMMRILIS